MKELRFTTERPKGPDGRDTVEIPINGEVYFAYRPSTNSIALFYSSLGSGKTSVVLNAIEKFLKRNLEPEAYALIMAGIENDSLEYEAMLELVNDLISEFSENPTTPSKGSTSSRAGTGTKSTANSRPRASTRDSSRRSVSSD